MSDIVLKVENLYKGYRLGVMGAATLKDDLAKLWAYMQGKEDPTLKVNHSRRNVVYDGKMIWALQDINFEVPQGAILGVVGKNGAGKSTLLKILSRVTGPSSGQVKIKGRIASLLEVGTGFHPELTGRENIFLNGAILGMSKREIRSKFDEIVDFAGVERYIDTPVKRYSSGMYVRLAFAVASQLEPEILIVDEVLAVGDAEFQKKAIGKMQSVSQSEGRTVLFVSHNLAAVEKLCTQAILLKQGELIHAGTSKEVVNTYLSGVETIKTNEYECKEEKNTPFFVRSARLINQNGEGVSYYRLSESVIIDIEIQVNKELPSAYFGVKLVRDNHVSISTDERPVTQILNRKGKASFQIHMPHSLYAAGSYTFNLAFYTPNADTYEFLENALHFTIIDDLTEQYIHRPGSDLGCIVAPATWKLPS